MIPYLQTNAGLMPLAGNPEITSLDGKSVAPLRTIVSSTWTEAERAAFGVVMMPDQQQPGSTVQDLKHVLIDAHNYAVSAGVLTLVGLAYPVIFHPDEIEIGCERHVTANWEAFDDKSIASMDALEARRFWKANRSIILTVAKMVSK